jgi:hypothetical protein
VEARFHIRSSGRSVQLGWRAVADRSRGAGSCRLERRGIDLAPGERMPTQPKKPQSPGERIAADLEEIHHLLDGFATELRKLDEAVETLAAYLIRLQTQSISGDRTLH